jgi:ABC-type dipeptide/oligopeptide/nickel transport system permease subunit
MTDTDLPAQALADDRLRRARPASIWRDTLVNLARQRNAIFGGAILLFFVTVAVFADQIATHDPTMILIGVEDGAKKMTPPCIHALGCPEAKAEHYFGVDGNVRDVFSRVVHGTRISLRIGFLTVGFAIVIGTLIGALAGYAGGKLDNLLMRLMDVLLAFPALLLAIAIVSVLGTGLLNAQLAIGIVAIPVYARIMRASVISIRERDFVTASRALGESSLGLLGRRIIPNALTPLIVQGTLGIADAVLSVAALSFLGLGAQPPEAEWGSMIGLARNQMFAAPHLVLFPGFALALSVLGFNLLGDGLRDALDPRLNR